MVCHSLRGHGSFEGVSEPRQRGLSLAGNRVIRCGRYAELPGALLTIRAVGELGRAARGAVLWGAGFTLLSDVLQFLTMLVLVRYLTPKDYGQAALARGVLGFLAVASFKVLVTHSYQMRDPKLVDWQAHFTAASVVNSAIFGLTVFVSWLLSLTDRYQDAAFPLALLSLSFLIEIPANLRHAMIIVGHDWRRLRILLFTGALIGSAAGLTIALMGGGVWALIVPSLFNGFPFIIDLFLVAKWRPDLSWSWPRYRQTASFGATRMASGWLTAGRDTAEQMTITGTFDLTMLGVFSRSLGLATLAANRLSGLVVNSLYPIITRTEAGSDQFRRIASLLLQAVAWITIPAVIFIMLDSDDLVRLLYGPGWISVSSLLPLATVQVGLAGIGAAVYNLLLANNQPRWCFAADVFSAVSSLGLMIFVLPSGPAAYLSGLILRELVSFLVFFGRLRCIGGIPGHALIDSFWPPAAASAAGACALLAAANMLTACNVPFVRLLVQGMAFGTVFVFVLRVLFATPLCALLLHAPGGPRLAEIMGLQRGR